MSPSQLPTDGAHILTLTSWLPKHCCPLSNGPVPASSFCPSNTGSPGCLPVPYAPLAGGGLSCVLGDPRAGNAGISAPASSSSLDSVLLAAAPAWAHHLFPGHPLGLLLHFPSGHCHPLLTHPLLTHPPGLPMPVIQAPACLPRQPPASPPAAAFPAHGEGHVDAVTCPESQLHAAQP